jgi:DNA-binding NarL/FixJ family response regulator
MSKAIVSIVKKKKTSPNCLILALTELKRADVVFEIFKAGASGYILINNDAPREILTWLKDLCQDGAPLSSEISKMVMESFHLNSNSQLSRKESEVLIF